MQRRALLLALIVAAAIPVRSVTAAEPLVVATVGPMTGQYAIFGEQLRRGAELAVETINTQGGVLGRKLRLEVGDDACDPKQAVAVANRLATRRVALVAGHYCSSSSIPALAVYHEAGILQITPASTAPALTDDAARRKWRNIFRTYGRDDAQAKVSGRLLIERFGDRNVAILHDKTAYGRGLADETRAVYRQGGRQEAMYEAITQGDKDFTALVTKMKAAQIGAIYLGGYHTEAGLIVRQARDQGLDAVMISGDALVTDEFWKIAGQSGTGTLMTFAPDPRQEPAAAAVVERFRQGGYEPEGYALYTYAAIQVWAAAATKAKSVATAKVADALRAGTFDTVVGQLRFDAKGDVVDPKYAVYAWKDGRYAVAVPAR
ncbi:branched-chain amino acid transport system substrate-binding protein [Stella humosa]|uniref:Branched-chain amino acid transport system substrate-binding protein n=1 Tax=Stella humosa TaxID=94 RepID=A0A3N1MDN3_9PROT|nr:branched-chain amino acid ABC transporter substrate-binding protein [Stella humosa]ROQ01841.1 branched-chain amino acid transport system substrate-binding protein [Stella humosa]BBK32230.1 branched chain amino acid ABC transporter substrate-binding protein [Stella humosa]